LPHLRPARKFGFVLSHVFGPDPVFNIIRASSDEMPPHAADAMPCGRSVYGSLCARSKCRCHRKRSRRRCFGLPDSVVTARGTGLRPEQGIYRYRRGSQLAAGCANSCGLAYRQLQNSQGNLYWRADGGFAGYNKAFRVLTRPSSGAVASTCNEPVNPASAWTFLRFAQWQTGTPWGTAVPSR
jgi:hypothetical protein